MGGGKLSEADTLLWGSPPVEVWEKHCPDLRAGQIIAGKYELVRRIAAGGQSRVYQVRPQAGGPDLALKLPLVAERLQPGAAAFPAPHPNMLTCYDVISVMGRPAILMEYVEGQTLAAMVEGAALYAGGPDEAASGILHIMIQAARGLSHIHSLGLVHHDVKPANMLLERGGRLVLADFAPFSGHPASQMGTFEYFSPERAEHKESGVFPDLWALALSVLECFLGRRPWGAGSVAGYALDSYAAEQWAVPPPPSLFTFFRTALARDISARYPSAAAMEEALTDVARQ